MAAIDVSLLIEDLNTTTGEITHRSASDVTGASCTYKLGALEDISWAGTGDVATAISPDVPRVGPRKISISLDNGASIDTRLFSKAPVVTADDPITLAEQGVGSAEVLGVTPIARQSAQQIRLADALYGAKGTVSTSSGNLPLPSAILPRFEGIGRTALGRNPTEDAFYRYAITTASGIADTLLDIDVNRDYVLHALDEILALLPAEVDPSTAQYVIDSSDFGVLGGSATIAVGAKGGSAFLTFADGATDPTGLSGPLLVGEGSTYQTDAGSLFDRMDANGGDTHHGAPEGGRITDLVCVGTANGLDTLQDTLVVSFYVDSQHGGTYVWQAGGRLLQLSQSIGVNGQWIDRAGAELYIAADSGIYERTAHLAVAAAYAPVGTMHRRCIGVLVDTKPTFSGGITSTVYALAAGNQAGQNGVLRYDGTGPIGGWTMLYPNDHLTDFCVFNGNIYALATDNQNNVLYVDPLHPTAPRFLPVPGGVAAVGLDPLVIAGTISGLVVRTALGSAALFLILPDPFAMSFIGDGLSLVDPITGQAQTVQVNQVRWHTPQSSEAPTLNGVPCQLIAATNRGLFIKAQAQSGSWHAISGQGNLGDLNMLYVASDGKFSAAVGDTNWPVYAANESNLYVSYDGALHFVDVFAKPLDAGPAFYDLYWADHGSFPPLSVTSITYGGMTITRGLDGFAQWIYTATNPDGTSVGFAARTAEISQISTPSGVPEGQSSRQLLDVDVRFLQRAATAQTILVIHSRFSDPNSKLRQLRPTHLVQVQATIQQCVAGSGLSTYVAVDDAFYVIEHGWTIDGSAPGVVKTVTTLSNILRTQAQDPAQAGADSLYASSRQQVYKTNGRR